MGAYSPQFTEDLINTYDTFLDEPEHFKSPPDVAAFLNARGVKAEGVTIADMRAIRVLREKLRDIWNDDHLDSVGAALTALLANIPVHLTYSPSGSALETLPSLSPDAPLLQRVTIAAAAGLHAAIAAHGLDRLRACESAPCKDAFIDESKNHTRRFCSDRCANRYNITAYRARQKE